MPNMFSTFDGQFSASRSGNPSRTRQGSSYGRSYAFEFGSFRNDFAREFEDSSTESPRGRYAGYRTQEQCPRDGSHSRSPPFRGRATNNYATVTVFPSEGFDSGNAKPWGKKMNASRSSSASSRSISPPSRRPRSPNPVHYSSRFRSSGKENAYRDPSQSYRTRGRSPTPPKSYGKYSQAPRRSPSPAYKTRTFSPSPPRRSKTQRETSPVRPPSPLRRARTQRETSSSRARPGTANNTYGARDDSSRYCSPSPRTYKTRSVSPPSWSQQRSSSAHNPESSPRSRRQSAQERNPPKKFGREKTHWYQKFGKSTKSFTDKSSKTQSKSHREESRHRQRAEDQHQSRNSSRRRPDTGTQQPKRQRSRSPVPRPKTSRHDSHSHGRQSSSGGYRTEERRPTWGSNARSPSPKASPRKPPQSDSEDETPNGGYKTEEHRPNWADDSYPGTKPSSGGYSRSEDPSNVPPQGPTGPCKPAPSRAELKKLFDAYNTRWEATSRTDPKLPMPTAWSDLKKIDFNGGYAANINNHTDETIVVANLQVIFLAGFGLTGNVKRFVEHLVVEVVDKEQNADKVKELSKWLSRKEQPRWHPDRTNLRTGKEGVIDEGISKKKAVVTMRSAVQALLEVVS